MFERYAEGARRTIFFARYEASRLGSPEIDTEHLLLGILREDKGLIRLVLLGMDYAAAYQEISAGATQDEAFPTSVDLPLSEDATLVLKYASEEADRLNSKNIGTEYLFLGLLRDTEFASAEFLAKSVSLELLRKRVESLPIRIPAKALAVPRRAPAGPHTIEIHDRWYKLGAIATAVQRLKDYPFFWERKLWQTRDVVFEKNGKRMSFDISLAKDSDKFLLVKGWWKRDGCEICGWELYECEDSSHGTAFTNGNSWVCNECYYRFIEGDYFTSAYADLT